MTQHVSGQMRAPPVSVTLASQDVPVNRALRRLRTLTIVAPVLFIAAVEVVLHILLQRWLSAYASVAIALTVIVIGTAAFSVLIFRFLKQIQDRLVQRNRQISAVHAAGLSLASEMTLDPLLHKFVDLACEITGARYGALAILDEDGRIQEFITSGIGDDERARIGAPPRGEGLLGVALSEGASLRLRDLARHPRARGFPRHHPVMRTLLGVPVVYKERTLGRLYLTEKQGAEEFTAEDEDMVRLIAAQAATSIENARLLARSQDLAILEERERIGMDLHDGVIQSLYGVGLTLEDCADLVAEDPALVAERLDKTVNDLNHVIKDIRSYIFHLRPAAFRSDDLAAALHELAREVHVNSLIEIDVAVDRDRLPGLAAEVSENLFHIAQEALANVAKHSRASRAWAELMIEDGVLTLTVRDNGRGFDAARPGGIGHRGLGNIADRARAIGGSFELSSSVGGGTRISVTVPLEGACVHA